MELLSYSLVHSPIGDLRLSAGPGGLLEILLPHAPGRLRAEAPGAEGRGLLLEAERQLTEYFAGERRVFDLPLDPRGTAFQRCVWRSLREIPYGETISYGELAARVGRATAARAAGAANRANPLPIVVPCHRVIARDGALTGYGGGLALKQRLLDLEQAGGACCKAQGLER